MTTNTTLTSCFTVHDLAGLEALPLGTQFSDRDGDTYIVIEDDEGRQYEEVSVIGGQVVDTYGTYSSTYVLSYGPLVIENAAILGEFAPVEVEVEAGDVVRITAGRLEGLVGLVLAEDQIPTGPEYALGTLVALSSGYEADELIFVQPLYDRADGLGRVIVLGAKSEVEHAA